MTQGDCSFVACSLRLLCDADIEGSFVYAVVEMRTTWKLGGILGFHDDPDFPLLFGYEIEIVGEPNVSLKLQVMPEDIQNIDIGIPTAMPAVNAIPHVCAARPGVVPPAELTLVAARAVTR